MLLDAQPDQSEADFPAKHRRFAAGVFVGCMAREEVMEQEAESYVFAGIRPEAKYLPQTAQVLELASKAHGTMEFSSVIRR